MIWTILSLVATVLAAFVGAVWNSKRKQKVDDKNEQLEQDNKILKKQQSGISTLDDARKLWAKIRSKH